MFIIINRRWQNFFSILIIVATLLIIPPAVLSQEETMPTETTPSPEEIETNENIFFDDVLVKGRPVFQVGSLPKISATARASIINRRIASFLAQVEDPEEITVQFDQNREIATLQARNRILMTVTQQDAEDFGLSVEELAQERANQLNQALERQVLVVDVGQRVYGTIQSLLRDTIASLPALMGAFIIIIFTWVVAKIARRVSLIWAKQTEGDSNTELLISRLGYGGVWFIGIIISLGVLGLDFGTLLATLGLTSVAIGFSLKDVLSNYISGVILLAARPFRINDQVVIDKYEGTVTQIQLRATTMNTYDGRTVYIPNQEVFQASITNNTASPKRRTSVVVGIDYDADITEAKLVILNSLKQVNKIEKYPEPVILVQELGASTVNLETLFWVNSQRAGFLETTSEAAQAIKEALESADIEMPTDIYTIAFRNSPQDASEQS